MTVPLATPTSTPARAVPSTSTYSSSPIRSSPLTAPPVFHPERAPSPRPPPYAHPPKRAVPIPAPARKPRAVSGSYTRLARHSLSPAAPCSPFSPSPPSHAPSAWPANTASMPASASSAPWTDLLALPAAAGPSPPSPTPSPSTPPLSRSQPLLGSYPLSLLHARMSAPAGRPALGPDTFTLRLSAIGRGRACAADLRCPAPIHVPVAAAYYAVDDGQTPWVGTADVEAHYFEAYGWGAHAYGHGHGHEYGQRQEQEHEQDQGHGQRWRGHGNGHGTRAVSDPSGTRPPRPPKDQPPAYPGYRVPPLGQLQVLVASAAHPLKVFVVPYDLRAVRPGGRLLARERVFAPAEPGPASSASSPGAGTGNGNGRGSLRYALQLQFVCVAEPRGPAYYVARVVRVVFTSSPPPAALRSERTDELIAPSPSSPASSPTPLPPSPAPGFSPGSLEQRAAEWALVRTNYLARASLDAPGSRPVRAGADGANYTGPPEPDFTPVSVSRPASPFSPPSLLSTLGPGPRDDVRSISPPSLLSMLGPVKDEPRPPAPPSRQASPAPTPAHVPQPHPLRQPRPFARPDRPATPGHGATVWAPGRRGRRGSAEERALSERLRALGLRTGD
ncbi:hypothetical protein Q5752_005937 [Cryptotrichosporon argae]